MMKLRRPRLPGRLVAAKNHAAKVRAIRDDGSYSSQLAALRRRVNIQFRRYQRQLNKLMP